MKLWRKKMHARHAQYSPFSELINKKEKDSNGSCIWSKVAFNQIVVIIIWQKYSYFSLLISNVRFQAINVLLLKIINGCHKLFGKIGKLLWFNWLCLLIFKFVLYRMIITQETRKSVEMSQDIFNYELE